ncbi:F0F1 ATP synthase subunit delta [Bombiscardovia coagulans]|uniref:ATP synthase subunit delta n=1 Tax=Bombiscardovia coagulans TaxID=686666 RepID=A0A261EQ31_9BIFI|nr:F0F1 ATP synthase subunit delta [Bombiscardovia coagulans]OZG48959.1 ATP synthase F0F1 subunit delta [Bombiscardovia coagulans]
MRGEASLAADKGARQAFAPLLQQAGTGAIDVAQELFSFVTLLDQYPQLERALTDPSRPDTDKERVVSELLAGRAQDLTVSIVKDLSTRYWSKVKHIANAVEDLAVDAMAYYTDALGITDQVADELTQVHSAFVDYPIVLFRLSDEYSKPQARVNLLDELLVGKGLHKETMQLVEQATRDLRGRSFLHTIDWLVDRFSAHMNETMVTVVTAVPLTHEQMAKLVDVYSQKLGRAIYINAIVNPEVIGGMRVEYGSQVTDNTVLTQLKQLQRQMAISS